MLKIKIMKNRFAELCLRLIFVVTLCISGCEGDSEKEEAVPELDLTTNSGWNRMVMEQIETRGSVAAHVKAVKDGNDCIHLVYFEGTIPDDETEPGQIYEDNREFFIKYRTFNLHTLEQSEEILVKDGLNTCLGLDIALDTNNLPVVAYQGGVVKECGYPIQADVMFSVLNGNGEWVEHTGASGDVPPERNPYFPDGYAGANLSVAIDVAGNINLGYQFRWEGCDSMNFQYPDLRYVKKTSSGLDIDVEEEVVEGNLYINNSTGIQNSAGEHNDVLMSSNDTPVIFYYAHLPPSQTGTEEYLQGLRVAEKQLNGWTYEWIETGIEVGAISGAVAPSGDLSVAYYVTSYPGVENTYNHCLKFAQRRGDSWHVEIVDEQIICGNYCSLSFDASGSPAIAYHAETSRNGRQMRDLRLARNTGGLWENQEVESRGDIGVYNSLFFDEDNRIFICTYSQSDKAIYIYFSE